MTTPSLFTMQDVVNNFNVATDKLETNLNGIIAKISNNPNPSMKDLTTLQYTLQMYTNLINIESSVLRLYGDTMKTVGTNMAN